MPEAIVMQINRNEEDTERTYSVDEVCEGQSGIVVATKGADDQWTCQMQEPPILSGDEQTICKGAVIDHLSAETLAASLRMAAVEAREVATPDPVTVAETTEPIIDSPPDIE